MRGESEHFINPNARVWIGSQLSPLPAGTYSRYYTSKVFGNKLNVTFRTIGGKEEEYNKRLTSMSIELIARTPRNTDTLTNDEVISSPDWVTYQLGEPLFYDKPFPHIFKHDIIEQHKKAPKPFPQVDDSFTTVTADDLRTVKSPGFFIENCGNKHVFLTDEIIEVVRDNIKDIVKIKMRSNDGNTVSATYSLRKIDGCGKLPKSSQKVI